LIFCNNHLYKCYYFINSEPLSYIVTNSLKMMCKHRNIYECFKQQILLIYNVYLYDKYNKIVQSARYIHQDYKISQLNHGYMKLSQDSFRKDFGVSAIEPSVYAARALVVCQ
jgi:hypothetical protein